MDKLYKILRKQTVAALNEDYTFECMGSKTTYKKGTTFNVKRMDHRGVIIILGHGLSELIPREFFGKYTCSWVEVYKNSDSTIHKNKSKDVTKEWNEHWNSIINKDKLKQQRQQIELNNLRSKELKKLIKFVKSGEAEKELKSIECAKSP